MGGGDRALQRQQALQQNRERKTLSHLPSSMSNTGRLHEDGDRWEELLQEYSGQRLDSVYPLIADSHLLNCATGRWLSVLHRRESCTQLSHPGLQTQLKRSIKRLFEQDVTVQSVLIERLG